MRHRAYMGEPPRPAARALTTATARALTDSRRRRGTGLALACGMLLLGCGGEKTPDQSPENARLVRSSFDATTKAGTAKVRISGEVKADVSGVRQEARVSGKGTFDFTRKASELTLTTPLGQRAQIRTVGTRMYELSPPRIRKLVPGKKPWLMFDFEKADRAQYGAPLYEFRDGPDDPWQILGFLRFVDEPAAKRGTAKIAGEPTSHYRANLRMEKITSVNKKAMQSFIDKSGVKALSLDVWLDTKGRIRKLSATTPIRLNDETGEIKGTVTIVQELDDFGVPATITKPAKEQTDDVTRWVSRKGLGAVLAMVGLG